MIGRLDWKSRRAVSVWLLACAGLVYAVLIVGGVTRLTHSGLSIVQWQPLAGVVPPWSDQAWSELFERYRATPEFRLVNAGMALEGFKRIFWWEYAHRLMGRLAGVAFFVPLLWFVGARRVTGRLAWGLATIFALGAVQGALGWYMVASGLNSDPHVSALLLAAHLGLALLLLGAMLWTALNLWCGTDPRRRVPLLAGATLLMVFVMAMSGGLVAGSRAGYVFNTFPLMNGSLAPPDLMRLDPWYENFLHNPSSIQFLHRAIAWILIALVPALWIRVRRSTSVPQARLASNWMLTAFAVQISLGIATLLTVVAWPLAAAHQAVAVLLYASALWTAHALGFDPVKAGSHGGIPMKLASVNDRQSA